MAKDITIESLRTCDPIVRIGSSAWGKGAQTKVLVRCRECHGLSIYLISAWGRIVKHGPGMYPCSHCGKLLRYMKQDIRRAPIVDFEDFDLSTYDVPYTAARTVPQLTAEVETVVSNLAAQVEALAELTAQLEARIQRAETWIGREAVASANAARRWTNLTNGAAYVGPLGETKEGGK